MVYSNYLIMPYMLSICTSLLLHLFQAFIVSLYLDLTHICSVIISRLSGCLQALMKSIVECEVLLWYLNFSIKTLFISVPSPQYSSASELWLKQFTNTLRLMSFLFVWCCYESLLIGSFVVFSRNVLLLLVTITLEVLPPVIFCSLILIFRCILRCDSILFGIFLVSSSVGLTSFLYSLS